MACSRNYGHLLHCLIAHCLLSWWLAETHHQFSSQQQPPELGHFDRCLGLAEPLLIDPHLVVPATRNEMINMCTSWRLFMDCVQKFVEQRFPIQEQIKFQISIRNAVWSVTRLCQNSTYSQNFLRQAACIKEISMRDDTCGPYYVHMSRLISYDLASFSQLNRTISPRQHSDFCCYYEKFLSCVKAQKYCDNRLLSLQTRQFINDYFHSVMETLWIKCLRYNQSQVSHKCLRSRKLSSRNTTPSRNIDSSRNATFDKNLNSDDNYVQADSLAATTDRSYIQQTRRTRRTTKSHKSYFSRQSGPENTMAARTTTSTTSVWHNTGYHDNEMLSQQHLAQARRAAAAISAQSLSFYLMPLALCCVLAFLTI